MVFWIIISHRILCAPGESIYIKDAVYGRTDGTTCPFIGAWRDENCKAPSSLQKVREE